MTPSPFSKAQALTDSMQTPLQYLEAPNTQHKVAIDLFSHMAVHRVDGRCLIGKALVLALDNTYEEQEGVWSFNVDTDFMVKCGRSQWEQDYASGLSTAAVASKHGVGTTTVWKHLSAKGLIRNNRKRNAAIVYRYRAFGTTARELAKAYNISHQAVDLILKRAGVPRDNRAKRTLELKSTIRRLHKAKCVRSIASATGLSSNAVSAYLREMGLPYRPAPRIKKHTDLEVAAWRDMRTRGYGYLAIAKHFAVPTTTVYIRLKELGL